jgi:translation initiation factor IF-1
MSNKEDTFTATGKIIEVLPNALFRVKLENDMIVLGHLAGKLRLSNITILLDDIIDAEISVYDVTKCRITWRHKRSTK